MSFAEKLRQLRKQKNLSQEKIADLLGVSRQSVSKWENGLSQPDTNNLIRLAEILEVSLDELTGITSESQPLEQFDRNTQSKISKLVIAAYLIAFGSIIGFFCPPISNIPPVPKEFWIGISVVSGCLLILKNRKLARPSQLQKVLHMDIGIILLAFSMGIVIPHKLGLVKALAMTILLAVYMGWVLRTYFVNQEKKNT